MKILLFGMLALLLLGAARPFREAPAFKPLALNGSFDNFQQVWQENTQDALHRVTVPRKHRHYHLKISVDSAHPQLIRLAVYEGRNNRQWLANKTLEIRRQKGDFVLTLDGQNPTRLLPRKDGFDAESGLPVRAVPVFHGLAAISVAP